MARIQRVDASVMDTKNDGGTGRRSLSPVERARQRQVGQFAKLIRQLDGTDTVFEVRLAKDEKPITVRQRLLRAAADANVEIAVRKSPNGFFVGLMTPERRSNRGRKRAVQGGSDQEQ